MKHSKLPPQYKSDYVSVYPTGIIELSAKQTTEKQTRYIDVEISLDVAREIQQTLNLADTHNLPLGHAYWHIRNNKTLDNCWSCERIHEDNARESES